MNAQDLTAALVALSKEWERQDHELECALEGLPDSERGHHPDTLRRIKEARERAAAKLIRQHALPDIQAAYKAGFTAGIASYAIWQNGMQVVGSSGKTLKEAQADVEHTWNYMKPTL